MFLYGFRKTSHFLKIFKNQLDYFKIHCHKATNLLFQTVVKKPIEGNSFCNTSPHLKHSLLTMRPTSNVLAVNHISVETGFNSLDFIRPRIKQQNVRCDRGSEMWSKTVRLISFSPLRPYVPMCADTADTFVLSLP